jgi:hypothetical protein
VRTARPPVEDAPAALLLLPLLVTLHPPARAPVAHKHALGVLVGSGLGDIESAVRVGGRVELELEELQAEALHD